MHAKQAVQKIITLLTNFRTGQEQVNKFKEKIFGVMMSNMR
jgi:hypothetical protein